MANAKPLAAISYPTLALSVTCLVLSSRLLIHVNRYAVNVLFWDEWDFRLIQLRGGSLWQLFTYQHGPHRQGIGFIVDTFLNVSRYDSRIESFFSRQRRLLLCF